MRPLKSVARRAKGARYKAGRYVSELPMNKALIFPLAMLASISTYSNENDLLKFEEVRSIYEFRLSDTIMADLFNYFDVEVQELHGERHELSEVCFRDLDSKFGLIAITGNLHDYETLYGYRLIENPDESCLESKELKNGSGGRVQLGIDSQTLISILGKPDKITSEEVSWKLDVLIPYDKPIVRSWRAGPTNKKYKQVQTISGEYHTVLIKAEFEGNRLSLFEVMDYSEADLHIKNVYD